MLNYGAIIECPSQTHTHEKLNFLHLSLVQPGHHVLMQKRLDLYLYGKRNINPVYVSN